MADAPDRIDTPSPGGRIPPARKPICASRTTKTVSQKFNIQDRRVGFARTARRKQWGAISNWDDGTASLDLRDIHLPRPICHHALMDEPSPVNQIRSTNGGQIPGGLTLSRPARHC